MFEVVRVIIGISRIADFSKEINANWEEIVRIFHHRRQDRPDALPQKDNLSEKSEGTIAVVNIADRPCEREPTDASLSAEGDLERMTASGKRLKGIVARRPKFASEEDQVLTRLETGKIQREMSISERVPDKKRNMKEAQMLDHSTNGLPSGMKTKKCLLGRELTSGTKMR